MQKFTKAALIFYKYHNFTIPNPQKMNTPGTITTSITDNIATITFGHPASNSFPSEQLQKLTEAFTLLGNNPDVAVIILQSQGEKAFCAGASFDELLAVSSFEAGTEFFSGFANVINAMRTCPKLIVGRIQGKAVGGGVGLAAACDYCLATEAAYIKLSEFTIGIGPFVIAPAVERKMGKAALAELTLGADAWKDAQWAQQKGLYANTFSTMTELDAELDTFTKKLASYNPQALSAMKKVLWEGTENWDRLLADRARISGGLVLSDFTKAALQQFKG
jgi:methylglutaconyl-CoA hydratase